MASNVKLNRALFGMRGAFLFLTGATRLIRDRYGEASIVRRTSADLAGIHAHRAGSSVICDRHEIHGARRRTINSHAGVVVGGLMTRTPEPALGLEAVA